MPIDYLPDTNILILLFNGALAEPIPEGRLGYSVITEIELLSFPNLTESDEKLLRSYLSQLHRVMLESRVSEETIRLRRRYRLKTPDAIVVASAVVMSAVLLTNDRQLQSIEEVTTQTLRMRE
ncbi:MAG: type II toxin-antitoxin system VapC family toxin [Prochlorothrix sp.]